MSFAKIVTFGFTLLAFIAVPLLGGAASEDLSVFVLRSTGIATGDLKALQVDGVQIIGTFPDGNAIVIQSSLPKEGIKVLFREKRIEAEVYHPPSFAVQLFGGFDAGPGCEDPEDLPAAATTPANVCRIDGPQSASTKVTSGEVWVIDSGLDKDVIASKMINVGQLVDCTASPCKDETKSGGMTDELGHGTMIAGIIGAMPLGGAGGLYGVAPNVSVNVIKVFGNKPDADFYQAPLRGLEWVKAHATSGIVNISWGSRWIGIVRKEAFDGLELLDQDVHSLADSGVKVVIAAGNMSATDPGPLWADLVAPANAGGYRPANGKGGGIYAVAAVNSTQSVGQWSDVFWPFSAYGTYPPDYAEPGVDIRSLWRSKGGKLKVNTCSGTSFAAPALAGLLARSPDLATYQSSPATGDPVAASLRGSFKIAPMNVVYLNDNGGMPCP